MNKIDCVVICLLVSVVSSFFNKPIAHHIWCQAALLFEWEHHIVIVSSCSCVSVLAVSKCQFYVIYIIYLAMHLFIINYVWHSLFSISVSSMSALQRLRAQEIWHLVCSYLNIILPQFNTQKTSSNLFIFPSQNDFYSIALEGRNYCTLMLCKDFD